MLSRDVTLERDTDRRSRAEAAARTEAEDALRHSRDVLSLAMRGGAMGAWSRDLVTNDGVVEPGAGAHRRPRGRRVHPDRGRLLRAGARRRQGRGPAPPSARRSRPAPTTSSTSASATPAANGAGWKDAAAPSTATMDAPRSFYGIGIDVTGRKRTRSGARGGTRRRRIGQPAEGPVPRQPVARAAHAAERHPRLRAADADRRHSAREVAPGHRRHRAQRGGAEPAGRGPPRHVADHDRHGPARCRADPGRAGDPTGARRASGRRPRPSGSSIALDLDPFAGSVAADATRLQQVFWNLLNNAVKFTRLGGRVTVRAGADGQDRRDRRHRHRASASRRSSCRYVFTPFRQADARLGRQLRRPRPGPGDRRQLVELHGGTIEATSPGTGEGATFVVRLPACEGAESAAGAGEASSGAIRDAAGAVPPSRAGRRRRPARRRRGRHADAVQDDARSAGARVRPAATAAEAHRDRRTSGARACSSPISGCPASTATSCCGRSAPRRRTEPSPRSRFPPTRGPTIAPARSPRASMPTSPSPSILPSWCGR